MLRGMRDLSARTARVEHALEQSAEFRPLSDDKNETWLWQNHDLANLIENRLNVLKDPFSMTDEDRDLYGPRVTSDGLRLVSPRARENRSFWILDGRRRVGTVAILRAPSAEGLLRVCSLYVVPGQRRRGHATRVLEAVNALAVKCGLSGTLLSTEWSWQRAIRFYLGRAMWVWSWRHAIEFAWHRDLPAWHLDERERTARFTIGDGESRAVVFEAHNHTDRLEWLERSSVDRSTRELAASTFALCLAARGWPLLTETTETCHSAPAEARRGGPAELASRIRAFEARDRRHGWHVDTPRIPGLDYSAGA